MKNKLLINKIMEKMIKLSIDEFTITIRPINKIDVLEWKDLATKIILKACCAIYAEFIFGNSLQEATFEKLKGYTDIYSFGINDFNVAMGFHISRPDMGVCIKFSAKAWAVYQARHKKMYGSEITFSDFYRQLIAAFDDSIYKTHLTRIDFVADYFNYNIDLTALANAFRNGTVALRNANGRVSVQKKQCFEDIDDGVDTIYFGSRTENNRGFLRMYDKKKEQLKSHGFRIDEAKVCHEWIRCEAVYKGTYADQISKTFAENPMTAEELQQYIAQMITQKYRFINKEDKELLDFTADLIEVADGNHFPGLRCESPRDNSLAQSIHHIKYGSGLFSTLYKIEALFGREAINYFVAHLLYTYDKKGWISKSLWNEMNLWIAKHKDIAETLLEEHYGD